MTTNTQERLASLMLKRYSVDRLDGIGPGEFKKKIDAFLSMDDAAMEGCVDGERQRDQSVRFSWGHDHDFGSFRLGGAMGDRHVRIIASLIDRGWLPGDLGGKDVLDIGCWTGGTSLLLTALGARVAAIEEVRKYSDAADFLRLAFAAQGLEVFCASIYDLPEFEAIGERFDFALFAGVLYHLSDPLLALRILYGALRPGGQLLIETAGYEDDLPTLRYEGPTVFVRGGDEASRTRRGWNWFIPSTSALTQMLVDVGFEAVDVTGGGSGGRLVARATRGEAWRDMMRAGLSSRKVS